MRIKATNEIVNSLSNDISSRNFLLTKIPKQKY